MHGYFSLLTFEEPVIFECLFFLHVLVVNHLHHSLEIHTTKRLRRVRIQPAVEQLKRHAVYKKDEEDTPRDEERQSLGQFALQIAVALNSQAQRKDDTSSQTPPDEEHTLEGRRGKTWRKRRRASRYVKETDRR